MPLIFNYGPQSGWEQGTGVTNCLLRDGGSLLEQFCLKSLHSWVGRGAGLDLQDRPEETSRALRSGFFAGQTSLLMNEGIFLWIQDWVILKAWEGAEFCCRNQGTPWRCFFGPGQQATLQNVGDVALRVQFDSRSTKSRKDLPVSVTATQTMTECRFWRPVTILPSVYDEEA